MRNTNNVVSRGLLGLVALAALGVAAPARADVIYNNFGAGDTFLTDPLFYVQDYNRSRADVAGGFNTGANSFDNIAFEGAFKHFDGPNALVFDLRSDSGGLPGTILATSPVTNATGLGSILTWTLDPSVTLAANTRYWISARANASDGRMGWFGNNTGQSGLAYSLDGSSWFSADVTTPAFRVSGSVLGAGGNTTGGGNGGGGAVPEPSEWAAMGVLGLGLGGLVARKRRAR